MTPRIDRSGPVLAAGALALALAGGPAFAGDRALVIGIDAYADSRLSSSSASATADARRIERLLTDTLGYEPGGVRVLLDGQATRAAILAAFDDWLIAGTAPGDRAFLYFAGLGYYEADASGDEADGVDETLLPYDAAVAPGSSAAIDHAVSDDAVRALAAALDGRAVTIVVDAGHAGIVSASQDGGTPANLRAVALPKTRAIVVEPRVKAQKAEGPPLDTDDLGENVAVFSATSGGQAPVAHDGGGVFTEAYVAAVSGDGDKNGNGHVSNAEILDYARDKAEEACTAQGGCGLGMTPTLGPATAANASPHADGGKNGPLTPDLVLDCFAAGEDGSVSIVQTPPSPVRIGTRDIRFTVASEVGGNLVLLDVSDSGRLVQLFPNRFTRERSRAGVIVAGQPITVPDRYYGISFNADEASRGMLIALVTHEPIDLPEQVTTRGLDIIPREVATGSYLAAIAEALGTPLDTEATTPTRRLGWSVATLPYEIIP